MDWTQCSAMPHLWQNSTFPKRGTWNPKIWFQEKKQRQTKGRNKRLLVTNFLWFTLLIKLIIPDTLTLQEVNNEGLNPHVSLSICKICLKIIKKPIKILKYEHKFCLNCCMTSLRGKIEIESQCPSCKIKISKTDASPSTDLETMLSFFQTKCKVCSKKFEIKNHD